MVSNVLQLKKQKDAAANQSNQGTK
jgi:protein SCO1/2